ncbi:antitoxin [Mycobacterium tuberculosis]|uniref:antitoxin n=1 Tax=Mycobacterium tuberculosis TaxID=1773 RepID=UPI000E315720|nr:antitoxin [Mycobacterium tuberculosis]REP46806.1 antitoxin [Mycobacterium tuberculosis]
MTTYYYVLLSVTTWVGLRHEAKRELVYRGRRGIGRMPREWACRRSRRFAANGVDAAR